MQTAGNMFDFDVLAPDRRHHCDCKCGQLIKNSKAALA